MRLSWDKPTKTFCSGAGLALAARPSRMRRSARQWTPSRTRPRRSPAEAPRLSPPRTLDAGAMSADAVQTIARGPRAAAEAAAAAIDADPVTETLTYSILEEDE